MCNFMAVIQVAWHFETVGEVAVDVVIVLLIGVLHVAQLGQNFVSESVLLLLVVKRRLLH